MAERRPQEDLEAGGGSEPPAGGPGGRRPRPSVWMLLAWAAVMGLFWWLVLAGGAGRSTGPQQLTFSDLLHRVEANQVKDVTVDPNGAITGHLAGDKSFSSQLPTALGQSNLYQVFEAGGVKVTATGPASSWVGTIVVSLLPLLLIVGLFVWMGRRAGGPSGP